MRYAYAIDFPPWSGCQLFGGINDYDWCLTYSVPVGDGTMAAVLLGWPWA